MGFSHDFSVQNEFFSSLLREINQYNASSTLVGTVANNGYSMAGLAYGGGNLWSLDTAGNLRSVNPANASSTLVGTVANNGYAMAALAYGGGNLWSLDTHGNLRKVNPTNASSTLVGTVTGNGYQMAGLAYGAGSLWSLDVDGNLRKVNPANASSTLVGTVTNNDSSMAGATYEAQWTITTSSSPSYGGTTTGAGTYNDGTTATVSATPNGCYNFTNWTVGGTAVSTSTSYTFTASTNEALVAIFGPITYALNTTSSPAGTGNVSGGGTYYCDSVAQITATPGTGYFFHAWSGTGTGSYTGTNNPASATMNGNIGETASFLPVPVFQTINTRFGSTDNAFGFTITGTTNIIIVIEACTNLIQPAWLPLQTNVLTNTVLKFSDPQWTNYHDRFYRFLVP